MVSNRRLRPPKCTTPKLGTFNALLSPTSNCRPSKRLCHSYVDAKVCSFSHFSPAFHFPKLTNPILGPTAELSEMSTWIFEITPLKDFPETCLRIYVSEDCSDADILTANYGMFHFYLQQSQTTSSSAEREETASYAEMCRENLETTLSNLSLHLPATSSMISALLLGVRIYFIRVPSCYSCKAHISQSLGVLLCRNLKTVARLDLDMQGVRVVSKTGLQSAFIYDE